MIYILTVIIVMSAYKITSLETKIRTNTAIKYKSEVYYCAKYKEPEVKVKRKKIPYTPKHVMVELKKSMNNYYEENRLDEAKKEVYKIDTTKGLNNDKLRMLDRNAEFETQRGF